MKRKGFTLLESAVILAVTSILLGTSFYLLNLNKPYQDFEIARLLLSENLRLAQDLSFKKTEIVLNGETSTICGIGLLISNTSKEFTAIAYATRTQGSSIDCYYLASSSPNEFNFTDPNNPPRIFVTKSNEFTNDPANKLIIKEKLKVEQIKVGTSTLNNFGLVSVMFTHPYGDVLIFRDNLKIDFDKAFNIYLEYLNKNATITITKAGQVILK